jgi:hypothetical protein
MHICRKKKKIEVSPHVLRHTFLYKLAETKGMQYAKEASAPVRPLHLALCEARPLDAGRGN